MNRREILKGGAAVATVTVTGIPAIAAPTEYVVNFDDVIQEVRKRIKAIKFPTYDGFPVSSDPFLYTRTVRYVMNEHYLESREQGLPFHVIRHLPSESISEYSYSYITTWMYAPDKITLIDRYGNSKVVKDRGNLI